MTELLLVGAPLDYWGEKFNTDINIENGRAEELVDDNAIQAQRATVAGYMIKGTVPLIPDAGVEWDAYATREKTLLEMDGQVRQSVSTFVGGENRFIPEYGMMSDHLAIRMNEVVMSEGM